MIKKFTNGFVIHLCLYKCEIHVQPIEEGEKYIKKFYPEYSEKIDEESQGCCIAVPAKNNNKGVIVILLKETKPGLIAHECFHAVEFLMDYLECKLEENTTEIYAYLLEYLVDRIHERLLNE